MARSFVSGTARGLTLTETVERASGYLKDREMPRPKTQERRSAPHRRPLLQKPKEEADASDPA